MFIIRSPVVSNGGIDVVATLSLPRIQSYGFHGQHVKSYCYVISPTPRLSYVILLLRSHACHARLRLYDGHRKRRTARLLPVNGVTVLIVANGVSCQANGRFAGYHMLLHRHTLVGDIVTIRHATGGYYAALRQATAMPREEYAGG